LGLVATDVWTYGIQDGVNGEELTAAYACPRQPDG
jgi:hypothetical protein